MPPAPTNFASPSSFQDRVMCLNHFIAKYREHLIGRTFRTLLYPCALPKDTRILSR